MWLSGKGARGVAIGASMVVQGAFAHLQGLLGGRLVWTQSGVNGNTTTQVFARLGTDVIALNPTVCIIDAGMNDVNSDVPVATIRSNLDSIADALEAEDIIPFFVTMQPFRNNILWTAQREANRKLVSQHVRDFPWRHFELEAVTGNGASDPAVRPEYDSGDGLHINDAGDRAVSNAVHEQLFDGGVW